MKPVEIDYFFEEVQKIKIMVFDVDNATQQLADDDFLGRHECTLGQVWSFFNHIEHTKTFLSAFTLAFWFY